MVPAIVYRDKLPKMPEVIIEGILLEGHKMLLTGPSKANKTWCLINLAVSVATGGWWIDFACAKRKVLFIDLETDARTLRRRISRVAEAKSADFAEVAANLSVWPLRGKSCGLAQIVDELFARFEPGAFGMVIIDPAYMVQDGDSVMREDVERALGWSTPTLNKWLGKSRRFMRSVPAGGGKAVVVRRPVEEDDA